MASTYYYCVIPRYLFLLLSFVWSSEGIATVFVDKPSYCQGEAIKATFDGVEGTGVWVGIYQRSVITDFAVLPDWGTETLRGWILTCGERGEEGCEVWPSSGEVELETDSLEPEVYVVVVSEDHAALVTQAFSETFQVVSCGMGDLATSPPSPSPTDIPASLRVVSDGSIFGSIQEARNEIIDIIRADNDLIGKCLRLVFHDCVGGCDGCVDMTNPAHAGLAKPIEALMPIVDIFESRGLTRTDIWMLSALVATEVALPDDMSDITFDLHWIGRKTCDMMEDCGNDFQGIPTVCTEMLGPHRDMCHGGAGTATMHDFFVNEFGWTPQQITAIMGAHSVGSMHRENSGHFGTWDLSKTSLDAGYWMELVGNPPDFFVQDVDNSEIPGVPNQKQWLGIINQDSSVVMLNTDIALVRNVPDMEDGMTCTFNGPDSCSQDTPFMPHVVEYLADTRVFLHDFRDVLNLLIDHGHEKAGECPPGEICIFGFNQAGAIVADAPPVAAPTHSPAPPPTVPFPANPEAELSVDKSCYTSGEIVVVSFDNISATGTWIGIFDESIVTDFRQLPPLDSPDLKEWIFSCGDSDCHTWLSTGGVQLPTANLENGGYVAVISGPGGSSEGQAAANFRVGDC